jgi:hypothetical protein
MTTSEHVGLTALESERAKLLSEYDTALQQGSDDAVRTEHGVSCEAHFRTFLGQFLPRKYGVTKGYIITPDLAYAGPLEEWDIIITTRLNLQCCLFDRLEMKTKERGSKGFR